MKPIFGTGARRLGLVFGGIALLGGSVLAASRVAGPAKIGVLAPTGAWRGTVGRVVGPDAKAHVTVRVAGVDAASAEGAALDQGPLTVSTDDQTRARLDMEDGSALYLERGTQLTFDGARSVKLEKGEAVFEIADAAVAASIATPSGTASARGGKLSVAIADKGARVAVLRGSIDLGDSRGATARAHAGERATLDADGVAVSPSNDLAARMELAQRLGAAAERNEEEPPPGGLGELRARRPGKTNEADHALAIERHAVKVRIVGNVARTEIDETFANDTDDVLEGIYRFPLPARAQIERLALEVDGALVDGSFVDKQKGAAIFRGAIHNATPQEPKPVEQIFWVPGPWRDPALLEWQKGGRFELKIFPIPKRGARRVVLAYTETIPPEGGRRRYVYPMPSGATAPKVAHFSLDAQVLGADAEVGVRAHGYALDQEQSAGATRLSKSADGFTPTGDLEIEYAVGDRKTDVTAWGFRQDKESWVALAMRPKLPGGGPARARDFVIVLDAGRSMFGERFKRAARLATAVAGEMDREDRVTAIACDVSCKAMPGGLEPAGPNAAHDVDVFTRDVVPEGATDLVGAVRAAARLRPSGSERDLRVLVLSDGHAGAGYHRGASVAAEVAAALPAAGAEVLTVPIGSDADTLVLADVARGGGGVLVPYAPGERLGTVAIDLLAASYGRTLRDVTVTLPEGVADAAPAQLAPVRAGSELVVAARATGERVKGDVVLRGKLDGKDFEARWPVDLAPTTDAGNAFVPRLWAAARIADREREDPTPAGRAELVALSQRWRVASRLTSLLVLESEAMFRAFGIDRTASAPLWTGESNAESTEVASAEAQQEAARDDLMGALAGGGGGARSSAPAENKSDGFAQGAPAATATMGPPSGAPPMQAKRKPMTIADEDLFSRRERLVGRFMKRVWHREATVAALAGDAPAAVAPEKLAAARAAAQAAPDERNKTKELARLLALAGESDELSRVLDGWSRRDPLDADAITMRADEAMRRGDREASLRILGGVAQGLTSPDAATLGLLAAAHERAAHDEAGCAFRVAAAEASATPDAVARVVRCERRAGRSGSAERWLAAATKPARAAIDAALARLDARPNEDASAGDFVVDATWSGGAADLDLALVDPSGQRLSWSGRSKGVRVADATSSAHEALAVTSWTPGAYTIEVVRAGGDAAPVSGFLAVRSLGDKKTIPFTLRGGRATLARVDVRLVSELVAAERPDEGTLAPFDRGGALRAFASLGFDGCHAPGDPTGPGSALVTFAPTGRVLRVRFADAYSGTATAVCVARRIRDGVAVAPFRASDGEPTLTDPFSIAP